MKNYILQKENSIEETKKQLELILKVRKEQKEIIECAGGWCVNCDPDIKALTESIDILKDYKRVLKENEELKEKENKIYKEVQDSLAFAKFLIVKEREPDLFNQGRFYISQIIYDILNDVQNPEGIHKENKCIQYIDYIPIQKVKDIIDRIDYDIKKTKEIISKNTNIYASYRKNDYQIVRLRAMNTKSLDIKKRLQKLLESEE